MFISKPTFSLSLSLSLYGDFEGDLAISIASFLLSSPASLPPSLPLRSGNNGNGGGRDCLNSGHLSLPPSLGFPLRFLLAQEKKEMQILARNLVRRVSRTQVLSRYAYSTQRVRDIGQPTPASHPHLMEEGEVTPGIRIEEYVSRRKKLFELLPENNLAIVSSAPVKMMTDVVPYTFRQEADYLYLTGCQQPGGVAVLSHETGLCMFMPESTPNDIALQGEVAGVDAASEVFKAEHAYPISKLPEILSDMIINSSKVFHNVQTASQRYTNLDEFQKSASLGKVKTLSGLTHELRYHMYHMYYKRS